MTGSGDDRTWLQVMDQLQGLASRLTELPVPALDAPDAVRKAEATERMLWQWRRTVEANYLDARNRVPQALAEVALMEGVPLPQLVAELLDDRCLTPVWGKLNRWAAAHGVTMWPQDASNEGEPDDQPSE